MDVTDERQHTDVISISLPSDPRYATVARILVGGLAARLNLTYEALDDLQLAVESVLAERSFATGDETTVELVVGESPVVVEIGPVAESAVRAALGEEDPLGLRVVLSAVVDSVTIDQRAGNAWLRLEKRVPVLPRE